MKRVKRIVFRNYIYIYFFINNLSYIFYISGPAYYKRSAGAGALQFGRDADLQSKRVSIPEPERKSQFGRSSRTVSRLFDKSSAEFCPICTM